MTHGAAWIITCETTKPTEDAPVTKRTHTTQILLSPEEHNNARRLAEQAGLSLGALIRHLLVLRGLMLWYASPCCADGQRCYVPHMHPPRPVDNLPQNGG